MLGFLRFMKKIKFILAVSVFSVFILPQVTYAAWWNPFSWFKENQSVPISEVKSVQISTSTPIINLISVATTSAAVGAKKKVITPPKQAIVQDKVQSPVIVQVIEQTPQTSVATSTNSDQKDESLRQSDQSLVSDFNSISPDKAGEYAEVASKATGVPADFLLAMVRREAKSPGSFCYLTDLINGTGVSNGVIFNNVMKQADLMEIENMTSTLGLDTHKVPVLCSSGLIGFGIFLPRQWAGIQQQIAFYLEKQLQLVSPWNPQDIFMAMAVILKGMGTSGKGGSFNELRACSVYYTGRAQPISSSACR